MWKADNVTIGGATSNTYILTQAEVGLPITVTASYIDDGFTAENPTSDPTAAVTNVNNAGSVSISGAVTVGGTLTAMVTDADGITSTISYVWKANNVVIGGATSNIYTLTQAEVGLPITVTASYIDDGFTAENPVSNPTSAVTLQTNNFCDPLPVPGGNIVTASTSDVHNLDQIVSSLNTGDTLLLEDGTYLLNGTALRFSTPGVTLRSASGNPDSVILDGGYITNEIITVAASDVTIAEITIKRAYTHPIHIVSSNSSDTLNTLVYRVTIIDAREQAIKINPGFNSNYADSGEIACSSLKLTAEGRPQVDNSCYTGGIDAHRARDWVVRDNIIDGFWCTTGLSEYAIHFWTGSRDTVVKRNVILNSARGIGFGLLSSGSPRTYQDNICTQSSGEYVGHYGGVIKNNFIFAADTNLLNSSDGFDCGVCLWSACEATAIHNTVYSAGSNQTSSMEIRFSGTKNAKIYNNLLSHSIKTRDNATGDIQGNLENSPNSIYVNALSGDLHIIANAPSVINQGYTQYDQIGFDIDGDIRDSSPDIGADEL